MKKICLITIVTTFLVMLQACNNEIPSLQNEQSQPIQENITIEEAQRIFETYDSNLKKARTSAKKFEIKPRWDYAQKEKFTDGRDVVIASLSTEVPDYEYMVASVNDISKNKRQPPKFLPLIN